MNKYFNLLKRAIANPAWLLARLWLAILSSPIVYRAKKLVPVVSRLESSSSIANNVLICIYDLEQLPISFNVFEYLAVYNFEATARGKQFFLIILDQKIGKSISLGSFAEAYTVESREYRLRNLIAPACALFPACIGYSLLYSRDMVYPFISNSEVFPKSYDPSYLRSCQLDIYGSTSPYFVSGKQFASLTVPPYALELAKEIINYSNDIPVLTITLRASKYDIVRNSRLYEWAQFAKFAGDLGYAIVVIPDSDNPQEFYPISNHFVYNLFCYNLELRAAIYELAAINFGVANGPMILSSLNRKTKSTIMLNVAPLGSETQVMYEKAGLSPSAPYFWQNKKSGNFAINDSFDNIKMLFESLEHDQSKS